MDASNPIETRISQEEAAMKVIFSTIHLKRRAFY
jgi:hypothetical protein